MANQNRRSQKIRASPNFVKVLEQLRAFEYEREKKRSKMIRKIKLKTNRELTDAIAQYLKKKWIIVS